jgi:hypothetical protein
VCDGSESHSLILYPGGCSFKPPPCALDGPWFARRVVCRDVHRGSDVLSEDEVFSHNKIKSMISPGVCLCL